MRSLSIAPAKLISGELGLDLVRRIEQDETARLVAGRLLEDGDLLGLGDEIVHGLADEERRRLARRLLGVADVDLGFDAEVFGAGGRLRR